MGLIKAEPITRKRHDRILLRLLQSLDLPRLPQHPTLVEGIRRRDFVAAGEQAIKDQLKANPDEVMARGGFGSPTIFIDKTDMYFGNDRMPLIREALQRRKASAA